MTTQIQTPSLLPTIDTPTTPTQQSLSPQQYYQNSLTELKSWWSSTKQTINELNDWDARSANCITEFKRDYIFSIGDLMNRSICMAIAGGATYRLLSWNKPSLVCRTRNLGVSFVLSGWLFVPELFNPFLPKID